MSIKYRYMHADLNYSRYFNLQGIMIFLHRFVGQQICKWTAYLKKTTTRIMYFIANICYATYMQV